MLCGIRAEFQINARKTCMEGSTFLSPWPLKNQLKCRRHSLFAILETNTWSDWTILSSDGYLLQSSSIIQRYISSTRREGRFLPDKKVDGSSSCKWHFKPSDTESIMSQIRVKYLLMDDLEDNRPTRIPNIQSLLAYSAEHWPDHVRKMSSLPESELLDQPYDVTTPRFDLWFNLFWDAVMPYIEKPTMDIIHPAAFNGHKDMIWRLITRDKSNIDQLDDTE
jgi:hypothetical protein